MPISGSYKRGNFRYWMLIILLAVLGHFALVLLVKPSFLGIFKKSIVDTDASSSTASSPPNAIIVISMDESGEETRPVEIIEPMRDFSETEAVETDDASDSDSDSDDVLDLVNDHQAPLPGSPTTRAAVIPPKPVEITWPETKNLRHCLGMRITVRIRVDKRGEIIRVEPVRSNLPPDCTAAAERAARRIVFLPGKINGKPAEMWATIQIDFRQPSD